jgi:CBS domain-containing protein
MLCSQLMKTDVECVSPQTAVRDAARRMRDQNVGFLPVCDESMRAIGTITDRDIAVRAVAEDRSPSTPVQEFLTGEVVTCRPEDDVSIARQLMARNQKSRIICTNARGRIEGIISLSDIVEVDEFDGASTLRQVSERESRGNGGKMAGSDR